MHTTYEPRYTPEYFERAKAQYGRFTLSPDHINMNCFVEPFGLTVGIALKFDALPVEVQQNILRSFDEETAGEYDPATIGVLMGVSCKCVMQREDGKVELRLAYEDIYDITATAFAWTDNGDYMAEVSGSLSVDVLDPDWLMEHICSQLTNVVTRPYIEE